MAEGTIGKSSRDLELKLLEKAQKDGEGCLQYLMSMLQLCDRVEAHMSDRRRLTYIKRGLAPKYFKQVNVQNITTLEHLRNLFNRMEENEDREKKAMIMKRLEEEEYDSAFSYNTEKPLTRFKTPENLSLEERMKSLELENKKLKALSFKGRPPKPTAPQGYERAQRPGESSRNPDYGQPREYTENRRRYSPKEREFRPYNKEEQQDNSQWRQPLVVLKTPTKSGFEMKLHDASPGPMNLFTELPCLDSESRIFLYCCP